MPGGDTLHICLHNDNETVHYRGSTKAKNLDVKRKRQRSAFVFVRVCVYLYVHVLMCISVCLLCVRLCTCVCDVYYCAGKCVSIVYTYICMC